MIMGMKSEYLNKIVEVSSEGKFRGEECCSFEWHVTSPLSISVSLDVNIESWIPFSDA